MKALLVIQIIGAVAGVVGAVAEIAQKHGPEIIKAFQAMKASKCTTVAK